MQPVLARTLRTTRALMLKTPSETLHTTTPNPDLSGVHCVITGASSGIGRATARLLASKAAQCTLLARNPTKLSETHSLLAPGAHRTVVGDVGDPETWAAKHWDERPVHVLINAAGIAHSSLFVRTSLETVESVVRTNLMGTIMACQRLGKNMLRNESVLALGGKGCIVNVASLLAAKGAKGSSIYSTSKAGVVGLTRSLALELGPGGVRTNCILPGYVQTKMTDAMTENAHRTAVSSVPLGRLGTTEEMAQAILFLVTNSYANNCVLNLDGGLSAIVSHPGNV